jgi:4-amino-4-deoxy-L-arabinose transferase-like glycosyltransferase
LTHTTEIPHRWRTSSLALIFAAWAILQIGGLFTPGLLDDVDSIYIQVAREMLQRHDFVTPTIDGIRFFDKPPLMYWMAAGSMHLFGVHDWAARLPLALGVLALLLAVYALGIRFYSPATPFRTTTTQLSRSAQDLPPSAQDPDRAGLYAALALATCIGPYLYTRFYIPDILIALWMTLSVHLFLIALDRITPNPSTGTYPGAPRLASETWVRRMRNSALLPCLAFAAVTALNLLTKGLIGIVFPLGFVLLYLAFTHQLKLLRKLHLIPSTLVFLAIAAPWHILAALRNPPIPMPPGVGLPAHAGWAWFYLYNEHIARFLGRRIPHDYGQVPIPIFWALLLLWLLPWVAFLPAAILDAVRTLRTSRASDPDTTLRFDSDANFSPTSQDQLSPSAQDRREAALACILWAGLILGFFTLSSRQEYYHLPALPALALLVGGLLAAADAAPNKTLAVRVGPLAVRAGLRGSLYFLVPLGSLLFLLCGYFALTAPTPHPGTTLNDVLSSNPALYNLSLGHVFDLTGQAMGFFRGPLLTVALCMLALGPISHLIRRGRASSQTGHTFAANLLIAAAMTGVLLAAHEGLIRFYPILGSKDLALAIDAQLHPGDLIVIDGELTAGSTLLFYTPQSAAPVLLVNGRVNGPWFGSFYPDAPHIFLDDAQLDRLWSGPHRIFLLTYHPTERTADLSPSAPVHTFATSGGKTILTNRQ